MNNSNDHSEKEARGKWCPQARVGFNDQVTNKISPDHKYYKHTRCIASDCMMWRRINKQLLPPKGYCGLIKGASTVTINNKER